MDAVGSIIMEKSGLVVYPSDGGKPFLLNENGHLLTKLTTIKQKQEGKGANVKYQYKHFVPNAENYQLVIVPRCSCLYYVLYYLRADMYSVPITKFDIQGNYIVWGIDSYSLEDFYDISEWLFTDEFIIDVYGYSKNTRKDNYGLDFKGANQFLTVSNEKELGYCVLRQKIKMSAGQSWSVPSDLPNPDNQVVFVRSDNPNCAVSTDRIYNKVTVSHDCNLYVVVFSSGFTPQKDGCGVHIWNERGELTYSSRYVPFFHGENVVFNSENDVVTTNLKSPMIRATDLYLLWSKRNDDWNFYSTAYKFHENKITLTTGIKIGDGNIGPRHELNDYAAVPTYAIEFSDYF